MENTEIKPTSTKKYNLREPNLINYSDHNNRNLNIIQSGSNSFSSSNQLTNGSVAKRTQRNKKWRKKNVRTWDI